jgi:hypothetical protein
LNKRRQIAAPAETHKDLCRHEHRADQHLDEVIEQRRTPALEHGVTHDLKGPAHRKQCDSDGPHGCCAGMSRDSFRRQHKRHDGSEHCQTDAHIKQHPTEHRGSHQERCRGRFHAQNCERP